MDTSPLQGKTDSPRPKRTDRGPGYYCEFARIVLTRDGREVIAKAGKRLLIRDWLS